MEEKNDSLFLVRLSSLRVRTHPSGDGPQSTEKTLQPTELASDPHKNEPVLEEECAGLIAGASSPVGVPVKAEDSPDSAAPNSAAPDSAASNALFCAASSLSEENADHDSLNVFHQASEADPEPAVEGQLGQPSLSLERHQEKPLPRPPSAYHRRHESGSNGYQGSRKPQNGVPLQQQRYSVPRQQPTGIGQERLAPFQLAGSEAQRLSNEVGSHMRVANGHAADTVNGRTHAREAERPSTRYRRSASLSALQEKANKVTMSHDPKPSWEDETESLMSDHRAQIAEALQAKQQFTEFLGEMYPEPMDLIVFTSHVMSHEQYIFQRRRRGLFNLQLTTKHASNLEVANAPARIALSDAMKQAQWVSEHYDEIESQLVGLTWQTTLTIVLELDVPQNLLDKVVISLYTGQLCMLPNEVQAYMDIASFLKITSVMDCLLKYVQDVLIPANPSGCNLWAAVLHPETPIQGMVQDYIMEMKWDGNTGSSSLQHLASLLASLDLDQAVRLLDHMRQEPVLLSIVECVKVCALLVGEERDVLLDNLDCQNVSMADIQGLLHWANLRRANRAVIANSSILWDLFCSNSATLYSPLEALKRQIGPQAANIKLWDLPLLHIPPNPNNPSLPKSLQYTTRRSSWMYHSGRAFCMEAVYSKRHSGWGLFCTVDKDHILDTELSIQLCVIWKDRGEARAVTSPPLSAAEDQSSGAGIGYRNLLSTWAAVKHLAWRKHGMEHLTLGLLIQERSGAGRLENGHSQTQRANQPETYPIRPERSWQSTVTSRARLTDFAPENGSLYDELDELDLLEGNAESPQCRDDGRQLMSTTPYMPNTEGESLQSEGPSGYQCVYRNVSGREELVMLDQRRNANSNVRHAHLYTSQAAGSEQEEARSLKKWARSRLNKRMVVEKLVKCCAFPSILETPRRSAGV